MLMKTTMMLMMMTIMMMMHGNDEDDMHEDDEAEDKDCDVNDVRRRRWGMSRWVATGDVERWVEEVGSE